MLDTIVMLDAIPKRFKGIKNKTEQYFAMARGSENSKAMGMSKWFNTNYHFIVPEIEEGMDFKLNFEKIENEYMQAKKLGVKTKINLIGPVTFLALSCCDCKKNPFEYYNKIIDIYEKLFIKISGLDDYVFVQLEEPVFTKDVNEDLLSFLENACNRLATLKSNLKLIVTTYFGHSTEAMKIISKTPLWGMAIDFVHGKKNIECLDFIKDKMLIAGVVNGRNIWANDFEETLGVLNEISKKIPKENIIISSSCSLMHVPYSVENEPECSLNKFFSFAFEKTYEIKAISDLFFAKQYTKDNKQIIENNKKLIKEKNESLGSFNKKINAGKFNTGLKRRKNTKEKRKALQKKEFNLPFLPTTTIGSFPQSKELQALRKKAKKGFVSVDDYEDKIKKYINECISFQEKEGLDVLVHGEPERGDMVEYFASRLSGFHITTNGWVQSYGSRCVKPPVIFNDIMRENPLTVKWTKYAQKKTEKPVKGILTGPVTIYCWSFPREDMPSEIVSRQIASALSEEVKQLQDEGIRVIQVDEPAFREGFPLRKIDWNNYEKWAIDNFNICVSTAKEKTQIHTHMCYSDFSYILKVIEKMDVDVITLESSKNKNRFLEAFKNNNINYYIGPGVYDVHSPRIPYVSEFKEEIKKRIETIGCQNLWINPDCGLKTRDWSQVKPALKNMVKAVSLCRKELMSKSNVNES